MPINWQTYPVKLEGGLILNEGRIEQGINKPGSAISLVNFESDVEGGYSKIKGFIKFDDAAVPGTGQIWSSIALSSTETLACRGNQHYYSTRAGWTSKLTLSSTPIGKTRHCHYKWSSARRTVIVDSTNNPVFFDHVAKTMSSMASPPTEVQSAQGVVEFKNHLFFSKNNYLTFTAPFTEDDFDVGDGAGQINIGDDIIGMIVFREQLFIFCANSIYRISGTSSSNFNLDPVTTNTGCVSGDTIQEVGGDIVYLAPDGVRFLSASERNNDFGLSRASEAIQKKVVNLLKNNSVFSSITLPGKNQYRLFSFSSSIPASEALGYLGVFYSNQSSSMVSWSELLGLKVYNVSRFQEGNSDLIVFCSDLGFIYQMEVGFAFDGAPISCEFQTPYIPISDPLIRKTIYSQTLYTKTEGLFSLDLQPLFDYNVGSIIPPSVRFENFQDSSFWNGFNWNSGVWSSSQLNQVDFKTKLLGSFFTISFKYSESSVNPAFNLNFIMLEYKDNDRR
jgi:hypothetical protein